jgi:hypothetical protein
MCGALVRKSYDRQKAVLGLRPAMSVLVVLVARVFYVVLHLYGSAAC